MNTYIWFTAQTGVINLVEPKAPTNYYRYKLPALLLGWLKLNVDRAELGPAGLEYPEGFLRELSSKEVK